MKVKRKLYPNNLDKEFVLMSVNDLKLFADYISIFSGPVEAEEGIKNFLKIFNLKTPASHLKKTKKEKTRENLNNSLKLIDPVTIELDRKVLDIYAETAPRSVND